MKLDEAQLSRAAVLVRERQLQQLPDADACPEHVFSDVFERDDAVCRGMSDTLLYENRDRTLEGIKADFA